MGRAQRNPSFAIQSNRSGGFRGACHRARIRATRWLYPPYEIIPLTLPSRADHGLRGQHGLHDEAAGAGVHDADGA
jgi:hypothetical protein